MGVMGGVLSSGGGGGSVDLSTTVILAPATSMRNVIQASTTGIVPLTIKLASGSTSNLQEWQKSDGTVLIKITKDGWVNYSSDSVSNNSSQYQFGVVCTAGGGGSAFRVYLGAGSGYIGCNGTPILISNSVGLDRITVGEYHTGYKGISLEEAHKIWFCNVYNNDNRNLAITKNAAGILKLTDGSTGNGSLILGAYSASTVGLTVKGYTSQSANLQEWQNSSGTVLTKINSSGAISTHATSSIDYTTTTAGSYVGFAGSASTVLLADGTAANNIRLDNDTFGRFRIIKGASLLAQFGTSQIDLSYPVVGASNIQAKGNLQSYRTALQTANNLQQFGNLYLDGFNGGAYGGTNPSDGFGIWGCAILASDNGTVYLAHTQEYIAATAANASFKARVVNKVGDKDSGSGSYPYSAKEYLRAESDGTYALTSIGGSAVNASTSLIVSSPTATYVPLVAKGATSQSGNLQEWQNSSATVLSRVDKNGTLVTKVNSAPADGDLVANECSWYFDSTNGSAKVKFKGKSADGTVVTGELTLA